MDISLRILVVEESGTDDMVALKALHSNGYHQMYRRVEATEDQILALKDGPWGRNIKKPANRAIS